MKTRLLILTSILALSASIAGCSDDGDSSNGGSGATGGTGASGGSGGTGAGGSGGGTTLPKDACVDLQTEYEASYDVGGEMKTIGDIAGDCGRGMCLGDLGTDNFGPCVQTCIDTATNNAIAANDCSRCVVITVEVAATSCVSKCISDKNECGPNGDLSCCTACLCENNAYDQLVSCTGIPSTTCDAYAAQ
ncbi:MAG: hypothetical protein H6718_15705 [Polyangiaceae bacterium]|nr:hypothetical protein [Polyangiaceae bacterium]